MNLIILPLKENKRERKEKQNIEHIDIIASYDQFGELLKQRGI